LVEVVEGQSHTITCFVSSISVITDVTWIKTTAVGYEIVNVVGLDGKFSGGTLSDPSLTINNIAKSDEGTIKNKSYIKKSNLMVNITRIIFLTRPGTKLISIK
jgi:hypothetical protein